MNEHCDPRTGNLSTDHDYDFCQRYNMRTVESQRRNAVLLDREMIEQNKNNWFKISSAFTGD